MKTGSSFQFSRRALMKAAGSTLLVPTFLKQAFAQTVTTRPNLVLLMQNNGTHTASFFPPVGATYTAGPTSQFTSTILSTLLTDPTVGPLSTVISGIYLNKTANPGGDGHDWGWHGLYSGHDNISQGGDQFGGAPSVDQILIGQIPITTPFKTITCGVNAANYSLINAGRASWVCAAPGEQVPCQIDIYGLYSQVFGAVTTTAAPANTAPTPASTAAAALRLSQRKSVLDTVANDLTTLEGRLGPAERAKVDIHLQAIRDFENRLSSTLTTGGTAARPAMCSTVQPSILGVPSTGQGNEANAPTLYTLFMEFIANVIGCNMSTILTFQFGRGGEHYHFAWLNLPGMQPDFHNDVAHKDSPNSTVITSGTTEGVMVGVAQYQAGLVLNLAQKLAAFPQANGKTALDNSLVVYGNELATGPHGIQDYPIVFIGGAAGQLTKTGYQVSSGTQMHHRLGCTIENIMGMQSAGFGAQPACGVIQGLSMA